MRAQEAGFWVTPGTFNWAHQGGAIEGPSNTLFAMRQAISNGADGLELDVHRTSDGHLVICHDDTLDRTTNGTGPIAGRTLEQVQAVDSAYWWRPGVVDDHDPERPRTDFPYRGRGPADADFRVPTLAEVLEAFPTTPLNLELKQSGYERQLADQLNEANRNDVIVVSFSEKRLRLFRSVAPEFATAVGVTFLIRFWFLSRFGIAPEPPAGVVALELPDRLFSVTVCDRKLLTAAHRQGLAVYAWTVDERRRMERLIRLGVDGVMTNRPKAFADAAEPCTPRPEVAPAPPPTSTVNEVRVHGVGGSPGPKLLGFADPAAVPVDVARSHDALTIRTRQDAYGTVEGFDWGALTSGSKVQALWLFLLPFTLLNVAGWSSTTAGASWAGAWRGLTRVLVTVAGWILTVIWVLWAADLVVNYVAFEWVPRVVGPGPHLIPLLPFGWWQLSLSERDLRHDVVVVGGVLLVGLVLLAKSVAGSAKAIVDEPTQVGGMGFGQGDTPFGAGFFSKRPSQFASLGVHLVLAIGAIALVVEQAWHAVPSSTALATGSLAPVAPIGRTISIVEFSDFTVLAVLVLVSWLMPLVFSIGHAVPAGVRRPNGLTAAAAVLATAVTNMFFSGLVLLAAKYLGGHPKSVGGPLPTGHDLLLLDSYTIVAVLWAVGLLVAVLLFLHFFQGPSSCGCTDDIPPSWEPRVKRGQAIAVMIHHADLVLVGLAIVFVAVQIASGWPHVHVVHGWQVWRWRVDDPRASGPLFTAAAWALPLGVGLVLLKVRKAAGDNKVRRFIGQLWDVLSFWPRRHHPLAVRPYSHIAVPALRGEVHRLAGEGSAVVVSAHSQGSVLAVTALAAMPSDRRARVALVTYGSHVPGLYRRCFPEYFNPTQVAQVSDGLGALGAPPRPRWDNFYRLTDPIGGPMFTFAPTAERGLDICVPDPATRPASAPKPGEPPLEHDRDPFVALAVHSYYLNEPLLKDDVTGIKEVLKAALILAPPPPPPNG